MTDTKTDFYRFPAMAKLNEWTIEQQLEKAREESQEIDDAYEEIKRISPYTAPEDIRHRRINFGMEVMDRIHCDETLLRMVFKDNEIAAIQKRVLEKNHGRGYYDE